MKTTLRELLNSQINQYESNVKHYDKLISSYLAEENYSRCLYYQTKKEELQIVIKDLKSIEL